MSDKYNNNSDNPLTSRRTDGGKNEGLKNITWMFNEQKSN